jgi:hypothetical protein
VAFGVAPQWPHQLRSLILADPGGQLEESLAGGDARARGAQPHLCDCAERVRRGDIDGAQLLRCHQRPCGWDKVPEIGKVMIGDNAHTLLGQASERRLP